MIEEVENSEWSSPAVPVRKPDGSIRLCVDMRAVNQLVADEYYTLPTLETLTAKLNGSKIFSVLDLTNAFHHVELEENSRDITTFKGPDGKLNRYRRLMFGLKTASETF